MSTAAVRNQPRAAARPTAAHLSMPVVWAMTFLRAIGAPTTARNIATVIAWGTAESGSPGGRQQAHGGWANFNPLNIVRQPGDGAVGQGGSQGDIADFGSVQAGAQQSARLFLNNGNAAPIIAALRSNAPQSRVSSAVNGFYSSWGGSINFAGTKADTTSSPSGAGAGGVRTISVTIGGVKVPLSPADALGLNPFAAFKGLAGAGDAFVKVISNWRFVVEVIGGAALVLLGVRLIVADISGKPIVPKPNPEAVAAVAAAAA